MNAFLFSLLLSLFVPRFVPRYFEKDIDPGFPTLTAEGRKAVSEELKEESPYCIEGSLDTKLSP